MSAVNAGNAFYIQAQINKGKKPGKRNNKKNIVEEKISVSVSRLLLYEKDYGHIDLSGAGKFDQRDESAYEERKRNCKTQAC